ncbi:MAG: hypothetical protein RQ885_12215 [Desulfurococcales archaeon]|jgi:hypothetical protein|nr:hypothetical protein [Desulfurococcales archaeon]
MILRALEVEALYEGIAEKGFGVSSLDGSPVPLGSTATHEPIEITRSLWGRWKSLDDYRDIIKTLWRRKHGESETREYQRLMRDRRLEGSEESI